MWRTRSRGLLDPRVKSGAADLFSEIKGARQFREGKAPSVEGLGDRGPIHAAGDAQRCVRALCVPAGGRPRQDRAARRGGAAGRAASGVNRWAPGRSSSSGGTGAEKSCWPPIPGTSPAPPRLSEVRYRIFPGEPIDVIHREFEAGNLEDSPVPSEARAKGGAISARPTVPCSACASTASTLRVKPLDDRRVRQAIGHALDRDRIRDDDLPGPLPSGARHPAPGNARLQPAACARSPTHPGGRGISSVWRATARDADFLPSRSGRA